MTDERQDGAGDDYFVDVAAVRIQTWLNRSAKVRYRRGASFRLADLTDPTHIATLVPTDGPVTANADAGHLSGVASVRFAAAGLTEAQARDIALGAAVRLVTHLRADFPALPLRASWGRAASYVEAYAGDMRQRPTLLDLPAQVEEGVASRPCGMCRSARAAYPSVSFVKDEEGVDLCVDCRSRVLASDTPTAGFSSARHVAGLPKAQRRLEEDLQTDAAIASVFPSDFGQLASWIGKSEGDAATQLCTIFADGNRIGVLMKAIAARLSSASAQRQQASGAAEGQQPMRREAMNRPLTRATAVSRLTEATRAAVAQAARAAADVMLTLEDAERRRVPALVHIADGDDVLMTVPAPAGWLAARTLATEFERRIGSLADEAGIDGEQLGTISISMGLVFHHASHPFADVVGAAEEHLKMAKEKFRGGRSAIAFLDYTADGESSRGTVEGAPQAAREALSVDELQAWAPTLDKAARVEAAQRSNLLQLLRETTAESLASAVVQPASADGETARAALARRVRTLGRPAILALVGGSAEGPARGETPRAQHARVRSALSAEDPSGRNDLRLRLDIARWWSPGASSTSQQTHTVDDSEVTP